jgi:hypothetical protein
VGRDLDTKSDNDEVTQLSLSLNKLSIKSPSKSAETALLPELPQSDSIEKRSQQAKSRSMEMSA